MSDGFITSIKRVLLREDAGTSQDSVPANNVGDGRIAGTPLDGPPGIAHRRRKRLAKAEDPKLYKKLMKGGADTIEMSEAGARRFGLGKNDGRLGHIDRPHPLGPIDARPEISLDGKDTDSNPRKKKSKPPSRRSLKRADGSEILLNPVIPTRFEDKAYRPIDNIMMSEAHKRRPKRPTQRCDFLVKMGLGDIEHLTWYRNAIQDPSICINSAQYRPVVAEVLDQLLDLIFADPVLYNRLRMQLLQNREREQSESVDDDDDPYERCRFASWKLAQAENEDAVTDTWKKVKGAADVRRPPGVSDEDWERHLLAKHTGTVNDKIKKFRVGGSR